MTQAKANEDKGRGATGGGSGNGKFKRNWWEDGTELRAWRITGEEMKVSR